MLVRFAVVAVIAALLWQLTEVALVVFAAILIAIALRGIAEPLSRAVKIPQAIAVMTVALALILLVTAPLSLYGARIWSQFDEIALHIPETIENIEQTIESHTSGKLLEDLVGGGDFSFSFAPVAQHLGPLAASLGKITSFLILMLFGGIYLAIDPTRYIDGVIYYTPTRWKPEVRTFLARSGIALRTWLFTQLLVVVMNGLFSAFGLWAFGVDSAVALGILAGVLSFIPYVGTIAAMVIGALATLAQGAEFAVYALLVLGSVSFFEGYFVTPIIQSRTLSIPPVVLLFSLFAFTVLLGTLGIVLAAPLTIVVTICIDTFYRPVVETVEKEPPAGRG